MTEFGCGVSRKHRHLIGCRRFAALVFLLAIFLGLTPQAMYMPPLRGSYVHDFRRLSLEASQGPCTPTNRGKTTGGLFVIAIAIDVPRSNPAIR